MSDATRMHRALAEHVFPALAAAGFRGTHPHYRRTLGTRMDLVSFQVDKWGGGFLIEIATCPAKNIRDWAGLRISPLKVTASHMAERERLPKAINRRAWYRYDVTTDDDRFAKLAASALLHLERRGLVSE